MNEASKTRNVWTSEEMEFIRGEGIDIGCGPDPITESVQKFDRQHGDANEIDNYVHQTFDFVFSAHCLEHMREPNSALASWWKLVRPGGHLILIVPDEDLYEQGYWPSLFNSDHKSTFTLAKETSWSPRSFNVVDLIRALPESELVSIKRQDSGYDRNLLQPAIYPHLIAKILGRVFSLTIKLFANGRASSLAKSVASLLRVPVDQTQNGAVAQIQAIARKRQLM